MLIYHEGTLLIRQTCLFGLLQCIKSHPITYLLLKPKQGLIEICNPLKTKHIRRDSNSGPIPKGPLRGWFEASCSPDIGQPSAGHAELQVLNGF